MAKKRKVLLVDDEIDFLEMLKARLEANDFDVVTASNGDDAVKMFKTEKPEALLLDILMPGTDGLEVLRKVRLEDKHLPIFIITAFSNEERFKVANQFNASGFIIKTADLKAEIGNIKDAIETASKYRSHK